MPRTPLQFQQIKDERKASILKGAIPLFALYGKDEVSIDLICAKAKCSHGLIYHYFKNVDEVFDAIVKSKPYNSLLEDILKVNEESSSFEKLILISEKLVQIADESKEYVAFAEIMIEDSGKNSISKTLLKLIDSAQKDGEIVAGNPADVLNCFLSLLKGIYYPIIARRHPNTKKPPFENIVQIYKRRKF